MSNEDVLVEARKILHLAVNYDNDSNIPQAIHHYVKGVDMLNTYLSKFLSFLIMIYIWVLEETCKDPNRATKIKDSVEKYLQQAENLKARSKEVRQMTTVEIKRIDEDSIGHSYENLFKHVLNEKVSVVDVEEPYMDKIHQVSFI